MLPASVFPSASIGKFKSEIPAEILLDFEHRFSSVLSRWGYRSVAADDVIAPVSGATLR
jgi:hypothetical protein